MLLKCYHYSHPREKFEVGCANQTTNVDSNLIYFLACILTNLKRCFQLNNLFCWPNDPTIDCEPPYNFVEVIEKDFWKKS